MDYSDEDILRQLRLGEDSHWEFKEIVFDGNKAKSPDRKDLADEVGAFANTDGGVILCGVTDDGDVRGMAREQMHNLEMLFVEICTDTIKPSIQPTILRKEIDQDNPFLMIIVPKGYALHDSPGGSYHRVGSFKRLMSSDDRLRLVQRRGQARFLWFDKQPIPGTGFASLDESLWKPLLSAEDAAVPELALQKMALLTQDETGTTRATVTGILLCCRSPEDWLPNACISATCYRDTDRSSGQIDAQTITGPLNRQITEAVAFAIRNMRIGAYKNPARTNLPQYSEKAVFEAIVNAVVHRDYAIRGSRIRLSMFKDRLEIISPGGLPNNLTIDSMGVRQSTRNEALTSILGKMSVESVHGSGDRQFFMEKRGDGVPIILRETETLIGKTPDYELIDGSDLVLTIPAAPTDAKPIKNTIHCHLPDDTMRKVDVLVLFQHNKLIRRFTAGSGIVNIELPVINLPMTLFVVADGCSAHLEYNWMPSPEGLIVEMQPLPNGGSAFFLDGKGSLPDITGTLNIHQDIYNRIFLYASNISINKGQPQPVQFLPRDDLHLTDADGKELMIHIVAIVGRSVLIQYYP